MFLVCFLSALRLTIRSLASVPAVTVTVTGGSGGSGTATAAPGASTPCVTPLPTRPPTNSHTAAPGGSTSTAVRLPSLLPFLLPC